MSYDIENYSDYFEEKMNYQSTFYTYDFITVIIFYYSHERFYMLQVLLVYFAVLYCTIAMFCRLRASRLSSKKHCSCTIIKYLIIIKEFY